MIFTRHLGIGFAGNKAGRGLGTPGRLAILIGSLVLVMVASPPKIPLAAGLCLLVTLFFYPGALRRLISIRWIAPLATLVIVNALLFGEADQSLAGIAYSSTGLLSGLQMALRATVILLAVDGFSSAVDIVEVASLFERLGMPGLGFAIGVAVNLLPGLRTAAATTWRSLQMRGGLRSQRWRGIQLYMITVLTNALRRGEEIALAAEARAFDPERTHSQPLKSGSWDVWVVMAALACLIPFLIFR